MKNNNNIENIKKMSKVLEVFSKIMMVMLFVAFGLSLVAIAISVISPDNMSLIMSYDKAEYPSVNNVISILINETTSSLILAFIMMQSKNLFKNIKDNQTPFINDNVIILKKLSKLLIALAVVPFIVNTISGIILSVYGEAHLETGYILIAVLFTCVSYIFAYGSELQKESDELL